MNCLPCVVLGNDGRPTLRFPLADERGYQYQLPSIDEIVEYRLPATLHTVIVQTIVTPCPFRSSCCNFTCGLGTVVDLAGIK
jgi:hypothetical protein